MSKNKEKNWNSLVNQAIDGIREGKNLSGKDGAFSNLLKEVIEASLEGELDEHLKENDEGNRRNGKTSKQVKTEYGTVDINNPRDRSGSFEPEVLPKRKTTLGEGLEAKIISLYSLGMSHQDIMDHVRDLYGTEVSSGTITAVTDRLLPEIEQWQARALESVYAFLYLDGLYFKSRNAEGKIIKKVAYTVLGIDLEGNKDILGIYMFEGGESAKMWMQVLSDLKERGVQDILIACVDNLSGFREAITSIFEDTEVQLCVIHQIRNSLKYVGWRDRKAVAKDLQWIYKASGLQNAETGLKQFEEKWGEKYPAVIKSWRSNWNELSKMYDFPAEIRKMIYTTNIIEGYHSNVRKRTKTKGAFINEKSIMKHLYLVQQEMTAKWAKPKNWPRIRQQLEVSYENRL